MIISSMSLDGLDLMSRDYYFHLSGLQDINKDVVTSDLTVDGETWGRSKNKPKTLVLDGCITTYTVAAEWALNRVLGRNGLKKLVINNKYQCQVEVTSRGSNADNSHIVTCQLTMPDPYLYALNSQSIQLGVTYSTGVIFGAGKGVTFGADKGVVFGVAAGESGTLTNEGNADTYPVITVIGTCSGISVKNVTTGEQISVSAVLDDSDTLVIDCRPATCGVYINGKPDIALKTSPGWIHCQLGDNQFSFSRSSLQNKKHCTVELQSRWI